MIKLIINMEMPEKQDVLGGRGIMPLYVWRRAAVNFHGMEAIGFHLLFDVTPIQKYLKLYTRLLYQ